MRFSLRRETFTNENEEKLGTAGSSFLDIACDLHVPTTRLSGVHMVKGAVCISKSKVFLVRFTRTQLPPRSWLKYGDKKVKCPLNKSSV